LSWLDLHAIAFNPLHRSAPVEAACREPRRTHARAGWIPPHPAPTVGDNAFMIRVGKQEL